MWRAKQYVLKVHLILGDQQTWTTLASTEHPPVKAKPFVDADSLFSIHPELLNDAFIYVHGHVKPHANETLIRIWQSTYLIGKEAGERAELIHAENITYFPRYPKHAVCLTWLNRYRNPEDFLLQTSGAIKLTYTILALIFDFSIGQRIIRFN